MCNFERFTLRFYGFFYHLSTSVTAKLLLSTTRGGGLLKLIKSERYGLNWIDVPEAFEKESENKIPVLKEVKEKAIKNNDGKPTHILIEGDNYHALKCLNYTHARKIDVIYIDPPYNTGSDGFIYKDARFLEQYPDGTTIPKEHPLRHSTWLSFMSKRLKLAKNLLSEKGVIFISIDDNEQANLKLLCDQVFGEENFVGNFPRVTKKGGKSSEVIAKNNDYVLIYSKSDKYLLNPFEHNDSDFKYKDEFFESRGFYKLNQTLDYDSLQYSSNLDYPIEINNEIFYPGSSKIEYENRKNGNHKRADWTWRWSKKKFDFGYENGFIVVKESKNGKRIYTKTYQNATIQDLFGEYKIILKKRTAPISTLKLIENEFSNDNATKDIFEVFDSKIFDYPKPTSLIEFVEKLASSKSSTILDFFAGSGTTLHATMKLNAEDGGNRQCILVQQKETYSNICESVTYERNRRVIQGYTNSKGEKIPGLGNSLKYYKTDFIGEHSERFASDEDKIILAQKAGCLISLCENTLEEIKTNEYYQFYTDGKKLTAIYFNEDPEMFPDFVEDITEISMNSTATHKTTVYVYCEGNPEIYENEFDDLTDIEIKAIPHPILQIYKTLNDSH